MKRRLPASVDLSLLEFLEYGDLGKIVQEEREAGKKTNLPYVSKVCNGIHRNPRILQRAFKIALERKASFPKQVIKA